MSKTNEELHEIATAVLAGKSRGYVEDSKVLAVAVIEFFEHKRRPPVTFASVMNDLYEPPTPRNTGEPE